MSLFCGTQRKIFWRMWETEQFWGTIDFHSFPMDFQWCPETAWLQTFFKISSFVFSRTNQFIQVCNYLRVSKWWQNFHFWVNYPFKYCDDKFSICWTSIVTADCLFSSLCDPFKLDWTQVQMFPFCLPQVVLTNQITTHVGEKVHCPQWNQADGKNSLPSSTGVYTDFCGECFCVKGVRCWKFRPDIPIKKLFCFTPPWWAVLWSC